MAKEDNTLLWVALAAAGFFVLNKTQLVSANSGASAIVPPAPAPAPGTPAAAPPTNTQALAVPTNYGDLYPDNQSATGDPITDSLLVGAAAGG